MAMVRCKRDGPTTMWVWWDGGDGWTRYVRGGTEKRRWSEQTRRGMEKRRWREQMHSGMEKGWTQWMRAWWDGEEDVDLANDKRSPCAKP